MLSRLRLDVVYKGTDFHGFADQGLNVPTVAGHLREALELHLQSSVDLTCAGRTDTGVHAAGQVVTLDVAEDVDIERLRRYLNKRLPSSIVVTGAAVVAPDFDARFSARSRIYHYNILNAANPDPFLTDTTWWIPDELNIDAMNAACESIVGEHDFTSFCRRPKPGASLTRRVGRAQWSHNKERTKLLFEIEANAFCHQMVRALVGHLIEIGLSKRSVDDMAAALAALDRNAAATLAPPQGLCLWRVTY